MFTDLRLDCSLSRPLINSGFRISFRFYYVSIRSRNQRCLLKHRPLANWFILLAKNEIHSHLHLSSISNMVKLPQQENCLSLLIQEVTHNLVSTHCYSNLSISCTEPSRCEGLETYRGQKASAQKEYVERKNQMVSLLKKVREAIIFSNYNFLRTPPPLLNDQFYLFKKNIPRNVQVKSESKFVPRRSRNSNGDHTADFRRMKFSYMNCKIIFSFNCEFSESLNPIFIVFHALSLISSGFTDSQSSFIPIFTLFTLLLSF